MSNQEHLTGGEEIDPVEVHRAIDHELAEAEREMFDADEQLRHLHLLQEQRKKRKPRFSP